MRRFVATLSAASLALALAACGPTAGVVSLVQSASQVAALIDRGEQLTVSQLPFACNVMGEVALVGEAAEALAGATQRDVAAAVAALRSLGRSAVCADPASVNIVSASIAIVAAVQAARAAIAQATGKSVTALSSVEAAGAHSRSERLARATTGR